MSTTRRLQILFPKEFTSGAVCGVLEFEVLDLTEEMLPKLSLSLCVLCVLIVLPVLNVLSRCDNVFVRVLSWLYGRPVCGKLFLILVLGDVEGDRSASLPSFVPETPKIFGVLLG